MNKSANTTRTTEGARALGQAVGTYQERAPLAELQPHFTSVWSRAVPWNGPGHLAIVPDGCGDLVWYDGALSVAGPERRAKIESVSPGKTVVGLRFQPGAASRWLGIPVSEFAETRVSLECFWGAEARCLAEWMGEVQTPADLAQRLEIALARRVTDIAPPDPVPPAIFRMVNGRRDCSIPVIRQLSDGLGLSERTLRRRCSEAFGYGPKTLDRILRFQRFLQLARTVDSAGTADLAADAGYSDQSHLTRDTHQLASMTPRKLRQQLVA